MGSTSLDPSTRTLSSIHDDDVDDDIHSHIGRRPLPVLRAILKTRRADETTTYHRITAMKFSTAFTLSTTTVVVSAFAPPLLLPSTGGKTRQCAEYYNDGDNGWNTHIRLFIQAGKQCVWNVVYNDVLGIHSLDNIFRERWLLKRTHT